MIYVSFVELFFTARKILISTSGEKAGAWICTAMFFVGFAFVALIDKLVPDYENPHEMHNIEELKDTEKASKFRRLYRVGIITAVVISIHNFPEGLVTFLSAMTDLKLGLVIARRDSHSQYS